MNRSETNRAAMYKARTTRMQSTNVLRKEVDISRRDSRLSLMLLRRNLPLLLINSPTPIKEVVEKPVVENKAKKRLEMLNKYRENKRIKLEQEKLKNKPIFKVQHVRHSPVTNYDKMFHELKGKPIKSTQSGFKLAPSSTYKFKPPKHVKPIQMGASNQKNNIKKRIDFDEKVESKKPISKVPSEKSKKSRKSSHSEFINKVETRSSSKVKALTETKTPSGKNKDRTLVISLTNAIPSTSKKSEEYNKPEPNKTTPVSTRDNTVYISPFVTRSRGKDNARKEYHSRRSPSLTNLQKEAKAAVTYFSKLLTNEIDRLKGLCDEWKTYEEEIKPPEEACDMIHVAIGQTELLLDRKFKQFSELINMCGLENVKQKVTPLDLHGYWDTALMQVNNLDQRFNNLTKLKINNWEEILTPVVKKTKKIRNVKKSKVKSSLTNLIKEARKKNLESERISSPSINLVMTRRLSNISNLQPSESLNVNTPVKNVLHCTPKSILRSGKSLSKSTPKSILKSEKKNKKSLANPSKSVLFMDDFDKENICVAPAPRRSMRLSSKLE